MRREVKMALGKRTNHPAAEAGRTAPAAGLATRPTGAFAFPGGMPGREAKMMTLGNFITRMERGWGFADPLEVMFLGRVLRAVVVALGLNQEQEVEVSYAPSTTGSGPNFHYLYRWRVRPWGIPLSIKWGRSFLRGDERGLELGYDW
jgi:hypothetical protein